MRVWAAAQEGKNLGRWGAHGELHTHCPLARVVSVGWEALKRGSEGLKRLLSQVVSGVVSV